MWNHLYFFISWTGNSCKRHVWFIRMNAHHGLTHDSLYLRSLCNPFLFSLLPCHNCPRLQSCHTVNELGLWLWRVSLNCDFFLSGSGWAQLYNWADEMNHIYLQISLPLLLFGGQNIKSTVLMPFYRIPKAVLFPTLAENIWMMFLFGEGKPFVMQLIKSTLHPNACDGD